jgi:hypothetical protein
VDIRERLERQRGHNKEWIEKYLRFIAEVVSPDRGHRHHILSKSLFPEFASFEKHPWNCKVFRYSDHLTAHYLLFRALPEEPRIYTAFFWMICEALYRADFTDKFVDQIAAKYQKARELGLPFPWNPEAPSPVEEIVQALGADAITDVKKIKVR